MSWSATPRVSLQGRQNCPVPVDHVLEDKGRGLKINWVFHEHHSTQ